MYSSTSRTWSGSWLIGWSIGWLVGWLVGLLAGYTHATHKVHDSAPLVSWGRWGQASPCVHGS
jgi:hypothetical protein